MMSKTSDLATLTQVLDMEAHTQRTRDSAQKHIPVSSSATDIVGQRPGPGEAAEAGGHSGTWHIL